MTGCNHEDLPSGARTMSTKVPCAVFATRDWEVLDVNIGSGASLVGVPGDELFEGATGPAD